MEHILKRIHSSIQRIGDIFSYLVIIMMVLITIEVVARYVFSSPTSWAWPFNTQIFGLYVLVAGFYTMSKRSHLRIDMLYGNFPPRIKFIARLVGLLCFITYMVCLIWQSGWLGYLSFWMKETTFGGFPMPLYPLKMIIPVMVFVFLVEGLIVFILYRD